MSLNGLNSLWRNELSSSRESFFSSRSTFHGELSSRTDTEEQEVDEDSKAEDIQSEPVREQAMQKTGVHNEDFTDPVGLLSGVIEARERNPGPLYTLGGGDTRDLTSTVSQYEGRWVEEWISRKKHPLIKHRQYKRRLRFRSNVTDNIQQFFAIIKTLGQPKTSFGRFKNLLELSQRSMEKMDKETQELPGSAVTTLHKTVEYLKQDMEGVGLMKADRADEDSELGSDTSQDNLTMERTICNLEKDVLKIQDELSIVQTDRKGLKEQRKSSRLRLLSNSLAMAGDWASNVSISTTSTTSTALPMHKIPSMNILQSRPENQTSYVRVCEGQEQELYEKSTELKHLRRERDEFKESVDKAMKQVDSFKEQCHILQQKLQKLDEVKEKVVTDRTVMSISSATCCEAGMELDDVRSCVQDLSNRVDDYRNKYLQAQQQVEEQVHQLNQMKATMQKHSSDAITEKQQIKKHFQDKIFEFSPLSDMLKEAQIRVDEVTQMRLRTEESLDDVLREYMGYKDTTTMRLQRLESEKLIAINENNLYQCELENSEKQVVDLRSENSQLKETMSRLDEAVVLNKKLVNEKADECLRLRNQLDTVKEESAKHLTRTKHKFTATKLSLQNHIGDLEQQLAQAAATIMELQKEQTQTQQRVQDQVLTLGTNLEEAQQRIMSLHSHVHFLRNMYAGMNAPTGTCMQAWQVQWEHAQARRHGHPNRNMHTDTVAATETSALTQDFIHLTVQGSQNSCRKISSENISKSRKLGIGEE